MDFKQKYHLWNYFFTALFIVLTILLILFTPLNRITISLIPLIVLALATFRLTRLITKDKILEHLRENIKKNKNNSFIYTIHELVICPWCVSIWAALAVTGLYFLIPETYILLILLAISGIASLLQKFF